MSTEKIRLKQAIVVEGKYDAAKISNIADTLILTTDGFDIFSDQQKQKLLKNTAAGRGLIILTDSDSAGFKIRHFIAGLVGKDKVLHAYIPDIAGKEKRKAVPSKEGLLGVEGISDEILKMTLQNACKDETLCREQSPQNAFTFYDLYNWGLTGVPQASDRKRRFLKQLDLPARINKNTMLQLLNTAFSAQEVEEALKKLREKPE